MKNGQLRFTYAVVHEDKRLNAQICAHLQLAARWAEHAWVLMPGLFADVVIHPKGQFVRRAKVNALGLPVSTQAEDADAMLVLPLRTNEVAHHLNRCGAVLQARMGGELMTQLARSSYVLRTVAQDMDQFASWWSYHQWVMQGEVERKRRSKQTLRRLLNLLR